jgi:hypothetical protein
MRAGVGLLEREEALGISKFETSGATDVDVWTATIQEGAGVYRFTIESIR